jgi:hypothetical protein
MGVKLHKPGYDHAKRSVSNGNAFSCAADGWCSLQSSRSSSTT